MKGGLILTNLEMNQNIADFIGNYCTKWNISASKFSEKCNIPYMTTKRILACNVKKIDIYTIFRIAQTTRTPIMEILGAPSDYPELYKRISHVSSHDKDILTNVLNILEKLHISGNECREIPYTDLNFDRKSYFLESRLFHSDGLDYSQMEKIAFRSTFAKGMIYYGFRLPNNALHPYYLKGNILLVMNDEPADGETGVFAWKEEGYIRIIFRKIHENGRYTELLPVNGRGRKYIIDNEDVTDLMNWVKLGVVVGIIH